MEPKVAFVIVCWNNEKLLAECFESIKKQTYKNHMTIMVDNGSKDSSVATARKLMPEINVIETGRNNGFARGNNIGISEALVDNDVAYVALINTDARLDEHWLERLVKFAQGKPRAAGLQGTTLDYRNRDIIDSTHLYVNHSGQAAQGHWQEHYFAEVGPKKVLGVNAAACLFTRHFIEAQPFHNFFDETMFMYLEDVDVAARATIMGWDNYLVPGARAYHIGSGSTGGTTGFSDYGLYMTFRNNLGMLIKNLPWGIVLRILWKIPKADWNTRKHLKKLGHHTAARKVLKGRLVSLVRVPIYIGLRFKLTRHRQIDKTYLWQLMRKGF
jgi:GT2 family glycosyltransferase